ncbi:hypothetical protein [Shinella kummerowiae]|jgi:hypothetical protein|uniref:hypothetical protein n=1 Tax=Shinella kummerowiae TaxID=417745 RepID=UPI0021B5287B|nr:hypothetical protein [Shinella kummerowiae]MCT7665920.1 hypothetical protein [Shinella kummerowiae]
MTIRLTLAALAMLTIAPTAQAQVFHDLPGVVTTEEHEAEERVTCEPRYVPPPENSSRQIWGHTVYDCVRGGVTITGSGQPLSRERNLRGLDW